MNRFHQKFCNFVVPRCYLGVVYTLFFVSIMKFVTKFLLCFLIVAFATTLSFARRGNPANANSPTLQFFIVDSDDNHPRTPTYNFVDTAYDAAKWRRVSTFVNGTDNGWAIVTSPDSIRFNYMGTSVLLPPKYIGANGYVSFDTGNTATQNIKLPTGLMFDYRSLVAGLWSDMELRTTGDTSKVFYRMTTDSCYVTFYNLFLKNTLGKVSATFQIAFANADSSVTINYRSFNGSMSGVPAAKIFQEQATIGVQSFNGTSGATYLDRGIYYARSYSSSIYALDLHTNLAVKFMREIDNYIAANAITYPPYDGYELATNVFAPIVKVQNIDGVTHKIVASKQVTNLATGSSVYLSVDSFNVDPGAIYSDTGRVEQGWKCGSYRLTVTFSLPSFGVDNWVPDNVMTRDFVSVGSLAFPFYDDFVTLDRCSWVGQGVNVDSSNLLFFDPPAPQATQSLQMNRANLAGRLYPNGAGDTMTTGPIDISGKSNVYLSFSYQRGAKTDSMQAGINNRTQSGPEIRKDNGASGVVSGDSLMIEAIPSTAATYNPATSAWVAIGKIYGGHDYRTQKYWLQIPSTYIHNHSRFRFRVAGKTDQTLYGYPFEDQDNFIIDEVQINAPTAGQKLISDLEPIGIDLGAGNYTRVPRNVINLYPKVRIASNGLSVGSTFYIVRLVMKDQLGREIYHRTQSFISPGARTDTTITMPIWDIQGSQGGAFVGKATIEQVFTDYKKDNDTASFTRILNIDDTYGLDDGVADTAGTMVTADGNFKYLFKPIKSDSLKGFAFYHLSASGLTNWTVTVSGPSGVQLAARSFSYNAITAGWNRQTFASVYLLSDSIYTLHFTMTQGNSLGGDASKSLMWVKSDNGTPLKYDALYPGIDTLFLDPNNSNAPYFDDDFAKNITGGGPILPMMRLVFTGSSQYLPVELISFTAKRTVAGDVALNFRSAKEQNLQSYEIERETPDGWYNIGSVMGKNSLTGASYVSLDAAAPRTSVTYRLWETDLDGSRKVLGTTTAGALGEEIKLALSVFPNPAHGEVKATISGTDGDAIITVFDALGRNVLSQKHIADGTLGLDLSTLAGGTYYVELANGSTSVRQMVVVTK